MNIFPVPVTKVLEKARTLELQGSSGKETEAERRKTGAHESHSTLYTLRVFVGLGQPQTQQY